MVGALQLELVIHVGRVLVPLAVTSNTRRRHFRCQSRIVLGYLAFLIPANCIAPQVCVFRVERCLGFLDEFRVCLSWGSVSID